MWGGTGGADGIRKKEAGLLYWDREKNSGKKFCGLDQIVIITGCFIPSKEGVSTLFKPMPSTILTGHGDSY